MQERISERWHSALKKVEMSPGACILAAFLLLIVPLKWLLAAWTAAFFHEMCHIATIRACRGSICEVKVGTGGAVLETSPMTAGKELLCALSGPFGSLLLFALLHRLPELAICGCIQGIYNLLPFYPLDGGRALRCLFSFAGEKGEKVFQITEKILWCIFVGTLTWVIFQAATAAALGCLLCFLTFLIKSSCKLVRQRVQ